MERQRSRLDRADHDVAAVRPRRTSVPRLHGLRRGHRRLRSPHQNPILVVGAMAISPDLLPMCATCVGIVDRHPRLADPRPCRARRRSGGRVPERLPHHRPPPPRGLRSGQRQPGDGGLGPLPSVNVSTSWSRFGTGGRDPRLRDPFQLGRRRRDLHHHPPSPPPRSSEPPRQCTTARAPLVPSPCWSSTSPARAGRDAHDARTEALPEPARCPSGPCGTTGRPARVCPGGPPRARQQLGAEAQQRVIVRGIPCHR